MFLVTIGINNGTEEIKNYIYSRMDLIKQEGFDLIYEDYVINEDLFIKCTLKDNLLTRLTERKSYEDVKYHVSQVIAETIIQYWEPRLIKKIVKDNYFYLSDKERSSVCSIAAKLLQEEKMIQPGGFYRMTRKSKVIKAVLDYLSADDILNIDGFVNFRLNDYINELSEIIERAIEIFVAEREYNEFIKLLRYFVEIQECKLDTLHLKQCADGKYLLLDEALNKINSEYFDELKSEVIDSEINYDDLLISTLITISPRKIFLHDIGSFRNRELVQTIKNVFADRIYICQGCEICSSSLVVRETNNFSI